MSAIKTRRSIVGDKHVLFHNDVLVHSFVTADENGYMDTDSKSNQMIKLSSCQNVDRNNFDREIMDRHIKARKPPSCYSVPLFPEKTIVRYKLIRDRIQKHIVLQFSVPLGPMYGPKGVMVKANLNGTKIRVLACSNKHTTTPDGQVIKMEYNETFPLPVAVDYQRVTARVDNIGYLLIGAPILKGP